MAPTFGYREAVLHLCVDAPGFRRRRAFRKDRGERLIFLMVLLDVPQDAHWSLFWGFPQTLLVVMFLDVIIVLRFFAFAMAAAGVRFSSFPSNSPTLFSSFVVPWRMRHVSKALLYQAWSPTGDHTYTIVRNQRSQFQGNITICWQMVCLCCSTY